MVLSIMSITFEGNKKLETYTSYPCQHEEDDIFGNATLEKYYQINRYTIPVASLSFFCLGIMPDKRGSQPEN